MQREILATLDDLISTLEAWRENIWKDGVTASATRYHYWEIGIEEDIDLAVNDLRQLFHAHRKG